MFNIHKYLIKAQYKKIIRFSEFLFVAMLIFRGSLVRQDFKSICLDNQSYLPRVTLNGAYTDDLPYNTFMVSYYMFQAEQTM